MSTSNKILGFAIILLVGLNIIQFLYFSDLQSKSVSQEDVPMSTSTILSGNKSDYIGKILTLDGYYVEGGSNIPLLITNLDLFLNNSLTANNYLIVNGTLDQSLRDSQGSRVYVKGKIDWANKTEDLLRIDYDKFKLIEKNDPSRYKNTILNPNFSIDLNITAPVNVKYAVLISGGIKPEKAYSRYWNDLTAMYTILKLIYHYDAKNIYVLYKDGNAENNQMPVDGPATHTAIQNVFSTLQSKMTRSDDLFIFTTNHGGSSGMSLWTPLDPYVLSPTQLNNYLTPLQFHKEIIVMEQCNSGVFIPTLSMSGRMIMTAASPYQSSWAADTEGNYDEFVYHFMSAVAKTNINGSGAVNADTDNNGKISMYEAFMYASAHDSALENPYYDDDGDGSGVPALLLSALQPSGEGAFGQSTYL